MGGSKTHLRAFTFVGVLILVTSLVFGLFQEARAIEMGFVDPPATVRGATPFIVDITIPSGKFVPITAIDAIVEQQASGQSGSGVQGKLGAEFISRDRCPMSPSGGMLCEGASLELVQGRDGVTTSIEFVGAFAGSVSDSNQRQQGYFHPGEDCGDNIHPGYGYDGVGVEGTTPFPNSSEFDDFGYGFGYGYNFETRPVIDFGTCNGYGYVSANLILRFSVELSCRQLQVGQLHYLTVLAKTGSAVLGEFSSPFTEFTPRCGGGGGGGGGIVPPGSNPQFPIFGTIDVTTGLPEGITRVTVDLAANCEGCTIRVTLLGGGLPPGSPGLPPGWNPLQFLELEVLDANGNVREGVVAGGTIFFDTHGGDPPAITLLHNQAGGWRALHTECTSAGCSADLPGFSVFALAVDVQGPTIDEMEPTGSIQLVAPTLRASWSDNRGIDTSSFSLMIDGEEVDGTTGDLVVTANGFSYVGAMPLGLGEHDVSASISDVSGLETTESWSFSITTPECPAPPRILSTQPTDGASGVAVGSTIRVTLEEGSCPITATTLTVNGNTVSATLSGVSLTATLPASVGGGETVDARVQVQDSSGNTASKSWSFETAQDDTTTPPPDDDGMSGWWWVLIVLLVIGAIAAVAYFVTQKK